MMIGWFFVGSILSIVNLVSLWWAVKHLKPAEPQRTLVLMWGSAVVRWLLTAGIFLLALQAGLLSFGWVFVGLWSTRWLSLGWLELRLQRGKLYLG